VILKIWSIEKMRGVEGRRSQKKNKKTKQEGQICLHGPIVTFFLSAFRST